MKPSTVLCFILLIVQNSPGGPGEKRLGGVYRLQAGEREGCHIWIVDGAAIRRGLYPEFLYGGNSQRYRFVPAGEVWIDNAISAEEFGYTVIHELRERALMARKGISYGSAHDSALAAEHVLRLSDRLSARQHEASIPKVVPIDCDSVKEIIDLPDSIRLQDIYRVPLGIRDGIEVWIVDGAAVRRDIYPDFGLSGNDRAFKFIPTREIWIDGDISCEETEFSIAAELMERDLMLHKVSYDEAYEQALAHVARMRAHAAESAAKKGSVIVPDSLDREIGTGDDKN